MVKFAIFSQNYDKILRWNGQGKRSRLGLNKFADLNREEFKTGYASCLGEDGKNNENMCPYTEDCPTYPDPTSASVNWERKGAVTPVKNQEECGSCWAFSATGSLEGLYYLNHSHLLSFSEQQIVDCDTQCEGCNGGWTSLALNYTAQYGSELEKIYPYKGEDGKCKYNANLAIHVNPSGYSCVEPKSVFQMMAAVMEQPVSIAVEADQSAWQLYESGIIDGSCGDNLDHGVLITGYDNKSQSWTVKNSWGSDWGEENGYIYINMDPSSNDGYGVCGILACGVVPLNNE